MPASDNVKPDVQKSLSQLKERIKNRANKYNPSPEMCTSVVKTTFSGASASVTGPRYKVALNGVVYTNTGNTSFYPGNAGSDDAYHQQYY